MFSLMVGGFDLDLIRFGLWDLGGCPCRWIDWTGREMQGVMSSTPSKVGVNMLLQVNRFRQGLSL